VAMAWDAVELPTLNVTLGLNIEVVKAGWLRARGFPPGGLRPLSINESYSFFLLPNPSEVFFRRAECLEILCDTGMACVVISCRHRIANVSLEL
jgi:hypothetical protein